MSIIILDIEHFNILEVSRILKISPQTIRVYIKNNKLPGVKIGNKYYITENVILNYLNKPTSINITLQK